MTIMESNLHGIMVPHVPTLLEYGMDNKPSAVVSEMREFGRRMKAWGVTAVVVATTHWRTGDRFLIDDAPLHRTMTTYAGFRQQVEYDCPGQPELAGILRQAGERNLVFTGVERHGADHAVTVPLHFMFPDRDVPVVPLSIAGTPLGAFRWGRTLGRAIRRWGGKVLFVASGSLSHDLDCFFVTGRVLPGYEEFDRQMLGLLAEGKGMDAPGIKPELIGLAKPEGGFRDLFMLLGVLGSRARGVVRAYEKLPGVGMAVVEFADCRESDDEWLVEHDGLVH